MNKTLYAISPDKQSSITKLFHLIFLLDSPTNKLDHMLQLMSRWCALINTRNH